MPGCRRSQRVRPVSPQARNPRTGQRMKFTAPWPEDFTTVANALRGHPVVVNVWASWCVSCRAEHPILNQFAKQQAAIIVGLNYKDDAEAAKGWLATLGNPYNDSVMDADGRIGIDWGVYGVPETFVIDKQGIVRYKHTGPVTEEDVQNTFLPLIAKLQAES